MSRSGAPSSGGFTVPRIDFCGHSIPAAGGTMDGDHNAYPDRLAKALGARIRANCAQGGSVACWITSTASGDGGWSWVLNNFVPPPRGDTFGGYLPHTTAACVHNIQNDLGWLGSQVPKPAMEALKTCISRYCSAAVYDDQDPSWTFGGGTWGNQTTGWWGYNSGSLHYATAVGTWAKWTSPTDYPGNLIVAIGLAISPAAVGSNGTMTLQLVIDGVTQPNPIVINLDKGGHADAENNKQNGIVLRIGRSDCGLGIPLSPGQHTIQLTCTQISFGNFSVDYAQIEADPLDGPVIIVPNLFRATSPTYGGYALWAGGSTHGPDKVVDPMNDASIATWNSALKQALLDFPGRTIYVDIDSVLGKNSAYFSSDYTHPSNRGHAMIADTCYKAIFGSGLLTSRILNRASKTVLGPLDGGRWRPMGGALNTSIGLPFTLGWVDCAPVGSGSTFSDSCAYYKSLDGQVFTRGAVKSGASASTPLTANWGTGWRTFLCHDFPVETYNGTTISLGALRRDSDRNGGAWFLIFNGQTSGSGFNFIEANWWADT